MKELDGIARDARQRAGDEREAWAGLHNNHDKEGARAEMDTRVIHGNDGSNGGRNVSEARREGRRGERRRQPVPQTLV